MTVVQQQHTIKAKHLGRCETCPCSFLLPSCGLLSSSSSSSSLLSFRFCFAASSCFVVSVWENQTHVVVVVVIVVGLLIFGDGDDD